MVTWENWTVIKKTRRDIWSIYSNIPCNNVQDAADKSWAIPLSYIGATVKKYLFNSRTRKLSKSISPHLTELKKLVKYYRFNETLKPMLRDHLVCGTSNNHWLHYLFGEEDLTRMQ